MKIRLFLIAALFGIIPAAVAQSITISGTIRDAHTQEPVSYASVYLSSSGIGTMSDSSGFFSFHVNNSTTDTLIISYVGYENFKISLNSLNDNTTIEVQLLRGIANTGVVIKTSINKGLFLWRKIMSKKQQYNRHNLTNFGYEAYNKLEIDIKNFNLDRVKKNILLKPFSFIIKPLAEVAENDGFLPAYLIESVSDYGYQRNPKKYYENIKASNTRGFINESTGKLLGVMKQNINIYSNFVNVMNKDFIGPFHDHADDYYTFSVPDTQVLNGNRIFHFVFSPKRPGQNTFEGDAWVMSESFQIQKISLYLGKDANINYIDQISVFQEFLPVNDSLYFLHRDKFFADFRVLGKKSLTLTGRKTTSYKNIVINNDSIAAHFEKQSAEEVLTTDTGFAQKTDAMWKTLRHDSLSKHEKAVYSTIDNILNDPRYQQLQDNFKFLGSGYKNFGNIEVGKWYSLISGNQWEGVRYRLDVGTNKGFNKNIHFHTYLAYGTLDKKFKGQGEAFWIIKREPNWLRLHVSYLNDVDNGINHSGAISADNVFSLAIRKPNSTRKFLQAKDLRFELYKEWGKGFSTEFFASQQKYTPLKNLPLKNNFPVNNGEPLNNFELAVKLRFAYLEQYIVGDFFKYPVGTKYPVAEFLVAKGIPGFLNSAYNYTKYSASVRDVIKISPFGTLTYKIYGGKINGTLPFTFLENHPGNDLYYYNAEAFNLMYRFEYISDKYGGINIEHNIGSGLFRFIPFTRKLKWRQFWNVKTLWGSLSDKNKALNNTTSFFKTLDGKTYMEAGTGIDNIFKILRFDFVWRILPTPLPVKKVSRFGIFGSFQFKF
ncbi:MAG: DUF5686 family protein [Chitinophagaceae bacterium]